MGAGGDIKGCFDNISHDWLVANVCMDKGILRKWLKAGFIEMGRLFPTNAGTPQGGIISPVLANIALDGLQRELETLFHTVRQARAAKVNLVRYADDFVITGSSKELLENEVRPLVEKFLAVRGLVLSEKKTKITHVTEGFDFLGWNVRYFKRMLLTRPSKKNAKAFLDKIRAALGGLKSAAQAEVIDKLTPVIRGGPTTIEVKWPRSHFRSAIIKSGKRCGVGRAVVTRTRGSDGSNSVISYASKVAIGDFRKRTSCCPFCVGTGNGPT